MTKITSTTPRKDIDMSDNRITEVRGTIVLEDGSTSEFVIDYDGGYQQWGAAYERLVATGDPLTAMCETLLDGEYLATDDQD